MKSFFQLYEQARLHQKKKLNEAVATPASTPAAPVATPAATAPAPAVTPNPVDQATTAFQTAWNSFLTTNKTTMDTLKKAGIDLPTTVTNAFTALKKTATPAAAPAVATAATAAGS